MKACFNYILPLLALMMFLTSNSCSTTRKSAVDGNNAEPEILFFNASIAYDAVKKEYHLEYINKTIAKGKIKSQPRMTDAPETGDITYTILDQKMNVIASNLIPCPLDKSVEYVNDEGQLEISDIHVEHAEFSLRLQLSPEASSIALDVFTAGDSIFHHPLVVDLRK